jgi:hypothetical protein
MGLMVRYICGALARIERCFTAVAALIPLYVLDVKMLHIYS